MAVTDVSFLRHCYRYSCTTTVAVQVRAIYILIVFIFLFLSYYWSVRLIARENKWLVSAILRIKVEVQSHIVVREHQLYEHCSPPYGYLDQIIQLYPTHFQWRGIVQFHLSKKFLAKFHSNGKRSWLSVNKLKFNCPGTGLVRHCTPKLKQTIRHTCDLRKTHTARTKNKHT